MSELVYTRVSTDEQSTVRQEHLLTEAGLAGGADGVHVFTDPATSSKTPALERPGFARLADFARSSDRVTVSELYRLCRDLSDILAVRAWCQERGVRLRVLSGALSGVTDLAGSDATTTMLVNVLVSVGQFQRDLQNELTRDGIAAARAAGKKLGRPARLARSGVVGDVCDGYRAGASIAALAREHGVSRTAVRTALGGLLAGGTAEKAAVSSRARVEVPGLVAEHLGACAGLPVQAREALAAAAPVRHGRGYSLRVIASCHVHRVLLEAAAPLAGGNVPASAHKAYRVYVSRVAAVSA